MENIGIKHKADVPFSYHVGRTGLWKRYFVLFFLLGILFRCELEASFLFVQQKTEVLVIGTVHQTHRRNKNYSYEDIVHILSTYNPDVVCVEIRPKDFRKEAYLKEMMLATVWGTANRKKVYPIDWWDDNNDRVIRDSLSELPEYKEKIKREEQLEKESPIITSFEKQYGTWRDQRQQGYEFWNGKEYNDYIDEAYRLSMGVFGDSPFNLHYQTRNDSMTALIVNAINENRGGKVIVLTGAEHKHYFDKSLQTVPGVTVREFKTILPLRKGDLGPVARAFFDEDEDILYYAEGYPKDRNNYYQVKLIDLLHGPDMDFRPQIVPAENIAIAEKVLDRWRKWENSSHFMDRINFETAWMFFLRREYAEAVRYLLPLTTKAEKGGISDAFLSHIVFRNLGFCYDMIGEREKAIASYVRGEELLQGTPYEDRARSIFKDYQTNPFRFGQ